MLSSPSSPHWIARVTAAVGLYLALLSVPILNAQATKPVKGTKWLLTSAAGENLLAKNFNHPLYLNGDNQPARFSLKRELDAHPGQGVPERDLSRLFSRIWKLTDSPGKPAAGSIYIFLANGTLLESSCVETYRVAAWTINRKSPLVLRIVEDGQPSFTALISTLTDHELHLRQTLVRTDEVRDLKFKAIEQEFVCPDLLR